MSRCSAEIFFFAGRSVYGAGKNHRKDCFAPFFAGRSSFRAEKVHGTWGGRWSAIDVLCEALFGELVRVFKGSISKREKSSTGLRKPFLRVFRFCLMSHLFMKVQRKIFVGHGRGKFLQNFI